MKINWAIKETEPLRIGGIDGTFWATFKIRTWARPIVSLIGLLQAHRLI